MVPSLLHSRCDEHVAAARALPRFARQAGRGRCFRRVSGSGRPTIMLAFPALTATRSGHDTLLTGSLPDESALYGVINQLEALGLQLLEIRRPKCRDARSDS